MRCAACDATVPDGARFCPSCGVAQPGEDATSETPRPRPAPGDAVAAGAAPTRTEVLDVRRDDTPSAAPHRVPDATRMLPEVATDPCPTCGEPVPDGRLLCPHCGANTASTGALVAVPAEVHRDGPGGRVVGQPFIADRPQRGRTAATVAAVVLGAATIGVLGAWVLTRGGGDPEPVAVEAPVFDPAAFPGEPERLQVTGIGATGTVDADGAPPRLLVDGDLTTAWRAVQPTERGDVAVALAFDEPAWVRRLVLVNGGPEDAGAAVLRVRDGDRVVADLALLDTRTPQGVDLPAPVLGTRIELLVLPGADAAAGPIAVSEIELYGHTTASTDG